MCMQYTDMRSYFYNYKFKYERTVKIYRLVLLFHWKKYHSKGSTILILHLSDTLLYILSTTIRF